MRHPFLASASLSALLCPSAFSQLVNGTFDLNNECLGAWKTSCPEQIYVTLEEGRCGVLHVLDDNESKNACDCEPTGYQLFVPPAQTTDYFTISFMARRDLPVGDAKVVLEHSGFFVQVSILPTDRSKSGWELCKLSLDLTKVNRESLTGPARVQFAARDENQNIDELDSLFFVDDVTVYWSSRDETTEEQFESVSSSISPCTMGVVNVPDNVDCCVGCVADLDCDGEVGSSDLAILIGQWGPCASCDADFDSDGDIDAYDYGTLLGSWGCCP